MLLSSLLLSSFLLSSLSKTCRFLCATHVHVCTHTGAETSEDYLGLQAEGCRVSARRGRPASHHSSLPQAETVEERDIDDDLRTGLPDRRVFEVPQLTNDEVCVRVNTVSVSVWVCVVLVFSVKNWEGENSDYVITLNQFVFLSLSTLW